MSAITPDQPDQPDNVICITGNRLPSARYLPDLGPIVVSPFIASDLAPGEPRLVASPEAKAADAHAKTMTVLMQIVTGNP